MAILSLERGVKIVSSINTFALTTLTLRQVQFCMMMMIVVVIAFPLLLLPPHFYHNRQCHCHRHHRH